MKNLSRFVIIVLLLSVGNLCLKGATSCSGIAWCGGTCTVTCALPFPNAHCENGVFLAICECWGSSNPNNPRINPSPTSGQLADAGALSSFLHNSTSSALQAIEPDLNDAISGASTQNWTLYWTGSDSCVSKFNSLSSTDKAAINTWRSAHGYTDPL